MQAKHAEVCSGVLFWTACTRRRTCCHCHLAVKNPIHDGKRGQSKLPKKSWTVPQCGHVTLNCVQMGPKQPNVEFSSHIFQFTRLHGVAVMQGLTFHDSVVTLFKSTRWYVLSGTGFLVAHQLYIGKVMRKYKIGKSSPQQPCENTCHSNVLRVIVALNGKSTSMLVEPTKNKLKQWRVIEKNVNNCNFFRRYFEIITKWMKKNRQICEDQIVTFKQSHILLYQGLLFLTRSTCVIVDARSHTCKSHDIIPRYDIINDTSSGEVKYHLSHIRYQTWTCSCSVSPRTCMACQATVNWQGRT